MYRFCIGVVAACTFAAAVPRASAPQEHIKSTRGGVASGPDVLGAERLFDRVQ
jgi:hypothetical protein